MFHPSGSGSLRAGSGSERRAGRRWAEAGPGSNRELIARPSQSRVSTPMASRPARPDASLFFPELLGAARSPSDSPLRMMSRL